MRLSRHVVCNRCDHPIYDEANGITIRKTCDDPYCGRACEKHTHVFELVHFECLTEEEKAMVED